MILVVASGNIDDRKWLCHQCDLADSIVAADGGTNHLAAVGRAPDVIVGDLDSVDAESLNWAVKQGAEVERHSVDKDETDLELALARACASSPEEIRIAGAGGGRSDQHLANILLLPRFSSEGRSISLIEPGQCTFIVDRDSRISGRPGDYVSLIPLEGDCLGCSTSGLKWNLQDETLLFGHTRGVSNQLACREGYVEVGQGSLLCIHSHSDVEESTNEMV